MNTARYIVRLLEADNCFMTTTIHLCVAKDENEAMEHAETEYPGCEFLSAERIEYPE